MHLLFTLLLSLAQTTSIYDIKAEAIDGTIVDFDRFRGKKLMIVNTASKCGYTPQYEDLQKLHELYGNQLVILGFPSNNFLGQEPGSNKEIAQFCQINYGVTFQMFAKIDVKGKNQHPLYRWLSDKELNGWNDKSPSWNFCKYLIDENGQLVKFYRAKTKPLDQEIIDFASARSGQ
ncbi:MAG: glutathione peroxidase [Bacteroidota bacterium]